MKRDPEIDSSKLDDYITGINDPDAPFNREDAEPEPEICRPCLGTRQECRECLE